MNFTKEEAEAKKGKRVRVRDDSFSSDGAAKGARGTVVRAKPLPFKSKSLIEGDDPAGQGMISEGEEIWVVTVEFDDQSILPLDIGKDEYERSLIEEP